MIVITRTKTKAEGSVKYECPERNDSLGKETKQPNLQKEERSDKSLRVVVVTKRGWVVNQINQTYFLKGLRMKKSVCLMAVLGAFCATGANAALDKPIDQTVNVKFNGNVVNSTCVINLLNGSTTLSLGSLNLAVAKNEGAHSQPIPLIFKVTGCDAKTANITDVDLINDVGVGAPTANKNHSDITHGTLATDKDGVVVQIYNAETAEPTQKGLIAKPTATVTGGGAVITVGWATLERKGKTTPDAGPVKAEGQFEFTFE